MNTLPGYVVLLASALAFLYVGYCLGNRIPRSPRP